MTRTNSFDEWMRHRNVLEVVEAAREDDRARDAAVVRIIDTMLEVQLDYSRISPGWPPVSPTAIACAAAQGELIGGGYGDGDTMLIAAGRTWKDSWWHQRCAWLLRQIPPHMAAAMLIQAARVRPQHERVGNFWCKTNRQLLEHQDEALQHLGLKGQGIPRYKSERTFQLHAKGARKLIRLWLEAGEVKENYQKGKNVLERHSQYA